MSRAASLPLPALLVALALSGCLGADDAVAPADDGTMIPLEAVDGLDVDLADLTFEREGLLDWGIEGTVALGSFEGSYDITDHHNPQNAVRGPAGQPAQNLVYHDITEQFPVGVPVLIESTFSANTQEGTVWYWINGPNHVFWTYDGQGDGKTGTVSALVTRGPNDQIQHGVWYGQPDSKQTVTYSIEHTITTFTSEIPSGFVYGLTLNAGEEANIEFTENPAPGALWVWDPADEFLGRLDARGGDITIAADAESAGEYVLFVPEYNPNHEVRIAYANGHPVPDDLLADRVQILGQEIVFMDAITPAGGESIAVTMEVPVDPLQVGFGWQTPTMTLDVKAEMKGPSGVLGNLDQAGHTMLGWGAFYNSDMGQADIIPGEYQITWSDTQSRDVVLNHWYVTYSR